MEINVSPYGPIRSDDREKHKEMILHTLLEEKCIYSAMEELNIQGVTKIKHARNMPAIMSLADEKYHFMCKHLGAVGLVSTDSNAEKFTQLRQGYRHGLDFLSKAASHEDNEMELSALVESLQKAGSEHSFNILQHDTKAFSMILKSPEFTPSTNAAKISLSPLPSTLKSLISHPVLDVSRYRRDFLELRLIGKGGYGKVFSVQHRLDGLRYAVKQIVLSMSTIRKLEREGCHKLDCLLQELRTLAKMDHPNIVRYFGGWLEYLMPENMTPFLNTDPAASKRLIMKDSSTSTPIETVTSSEHSAKAYPETLISPSAMFSEDIVFEDSGHGNRSLSGFTRNAPTESSFECDCSKCIKSTDPNAGLAENRLCNNYSRFKQLEGIRCNEDLASAFSKEDNLISYHAGSSRLTSQSFVSSKADSSSCATGPCLILHIQTSLHPLSLADFIEHTSFPETELPKDLKIRGHCFHAVPSLQILLTLMDGVQYLHRQGIVHRDIKPANVFLDVSSTASQQTRCIDLSACPACQKQATGTYQESTGGPAYLGVRIGDFGLVTAITQPNKDDNNRGEDSDITAATDSSLLTRPDAQTSPPRTKEHEKYRKTRGRDVGTHLYKPPDPSFSGNYTFPGVEPTFKRIGHFHELTEKLDVYALGIILLELLYPFSTQMERYTVLTDVRRGIIPDHLRAWKCGKGGQELKSLVSGMVLADESRRLGCEEIRRRAEDILRSMEG